MQVKNDNFYSKFNHRKMLMVDLGQASWLTRPRRWCMKVPAARPPILSHRVAAARIPPERRKEFPVHFYRKS
jgi:hypothetical protein